jgi:hypothetical protein
MTLFLCLCRLDCGRSSRRHTSRASASGGDAWVTGVLCAGCGCLRVRPYLSGPDLLSAPATSYGHTPNWGNTVRDRKGLGACPGGGAIPLSLSVLLSVQARRRLCLPIRRLCRVHRRLRSSGSFWRFPLHRFVLFCLGVSSGSGCLWFDSMGS